MSTIAQRALLADTMDTDPSFKVTYEPCSAEQFVLRYPRGAYTSARTFRQTSIIDFHGHMQRLCDSLARMVDRLQWTDHQGHRITHLALETTTDIQPCATQSNLQRFLSAVHSPTQLGMVLMPMIHHALALFFESQASEPVLSMPEEAKVTMVLSINEKHHYPICAVHVQPLSQPQQGYCSIEICPAKRECPLAKDSQWMRDRQAIVDQQQPGVNESVLVDPTTNELTEGLSSNFFTIQAQSPTLLAPTEPTENATGLQLDQIKVVAAPAGTVLLGTIMKLVLQVCHQHNVTVDERCPTVSELEAGEWLGAFITSTSRLVLPIDRVYLRHPTQ
ncbi:hypothetical protein H4R35_003850 [Dimargaris xerosporica]|nr:hypothetical protein H4R35_003850 [Dimargaris xerosporica]